MPVHILTIAFDPERDMFHDDELTRFLLNKRLKNLRPEFFQMNGRPYWSVFIEYEVALSPSPEPESEKEGFDEPQNMLYRRLREWRKEAAAKDGVPVYIIATNSQLADIVKAAPESLEALRQIHGFGKKKLERHGKDIIEMVRAFHEKKPVRQKAQKEQKDENSGKDEVRPVPTEKEEL